MSLIQMGAKFKCRGDCPFGKLFASVVKCVGHGLKLSDIFLKIWAPLRKLFAPWCLKLATGLVAMAD